MAVETSDEQASFGFREVPAAQKAGLVREVFDKVAPRYDLMNDVMSFGLHRLWKDAMVGALDPRPGEKFLDVAGGTGDIAFRIVKALQRRAPQTRHDVHVLDINAEMLATGKERAQKRGFAADLRWTCGDAEALPVADHSVDAYTIAFGIRNVTHIDKVLAEAHRVLKPGGRFFCLEFSTVETPGIDRIYDEYSFKLIPWFGKHIARDAPAYQYLVESIRRFPAAERFATMMRDAGFGAVKFRRMSGGVVALHSGWRL